MRSPRIDTCRSHERISSNDLDLQRNRLKMSSSPWDIPALLKQIDANGQKIGKDSGLARLQCLDAARSLVCALETPTETVLRHAWAEVRAPSTVQRTSDCA